MVRSSISMAIVDIIACLTTRAVVHIEDQIEPISLAPTDHAIDTLIAVFRTCLTHIILVSEEFVVEGQTDGVGTLLGDEIDIGTSDVVVLELLPELGREVWSHSLLEQQIDHPGRVGTTEAEHITLGVKPVAKVRALDEEFFAIGLYQVVPLDGDKTC